MPGQREGVLLDGDDGRQVGGREPADDGQPVGAALAGQRLDHGDDRLLDGETLGGDETLAARGTASGSRP